MKEIEELEDFDLFDDLVAKMDLDKELALKFFLVFSWFEYILKELGYYKNCGYVDIDWVKFGNELDDQFDPNRTPELKKAIEVLLEERPKNQRIENGKVIWQVVEPKGEMTKLGYILFWVTTVRNNFFHGGKFPNFRIRDVDLLKGCLFILAECVELHPEIKAVYDRQIW